jgi:hypothetical protein
VLPIREVRLPAGLAGAVGVSFVPGDVTVCENQLTAVLNSDFSGGSLSLSAADGGRKFGPFVYQDESTSWTQTPGAPPGQSWVTKFDPASVEWSVSPSLSAGFDVGEQKGSLSVQLASADIQAYNKTVTLVSAAGPLLEFAFHPALEFSVSVQRDSVDDAVEHEEQQGVDPASAEANVADELAGDATVAVAAEASVDFGVTVSVVNTQTMFETISTVLTAALAQDPVILAAAAPGETPAGEVTAGDVAAIDRETNRAINVDADGVLVSVFP